MSKEIYQRHCEGDYIFNKELNKAIEDYIAAERALFALGPYFEVTRKAITMVLISLQDMQLARARERKSK